MTELSEEHELDFNQDEQEDNDEITKWGAYWLCCYLYFVQGIVSSIAGTMPYIYTTLPSYDIMSIFTAASLPYSFKFLIAPILQKYSIIQYGKRKIWIMISQTVCGIAILMSSFYTDQDSAYIFAIICFASQICIVAQDISLDALVIKELKSPRQAGIVQAYGQTIGVTLGGLILLKLTSKQFSSNFGLDQPITSPQVILIILSLLLFAPPVLMHFFFEQTILQSQKNGSDLSIIQTYSMYVIFFKWRSKYFRTCIFFLIFFQGFSFFIAGYDYEMIKAGFSRDTMNSIQNIGTIPQIIMTLFMGTVIRYLGLKNSWYLMSISLIALFTFLLIVFPQNVFAVAPLNILSDTIWTFRLVIGTVMTNTFPLHALTGMFITFLNSMANFGTLTTLQTKLLGVFGWKLLSAIGLGYQFIMVLILPRLWDWMQAGDLHINDKIDNLEEIQRLQHKQKENRPKLEELQD